MKCAIHFGAGNIGRGFIGKLLADAGIHVTFADVNDDIVEQLKTTHQYTVKVVGEKCDRQLVKNVTAIHSTNPELLEQIAKTDLITTAVGPTVLDIIAKSIAQGITNRLQTGNFNPLNIIACENMVRGTSHLKSEVFKYLDDDTKAFSEKYVGFVDSAVDRIVPPAESSDHILDVTVESFSEWIVDQLQFVGEIPAIPGMEKTDNLMAFVERKLFTLNTGHCMAAYLGYLKHYRTIKDAIEDDALRAEVRLAMQQSGEVLIQRYGFDPEKHAAYINKILARFANPYLIDEVDRVGRQPIRKLDKNDRLIKPLQGTIEYNTANTALLKGIAAALKYKNETDPQAIELQTYLKDNGIKKALAHYSGLDEDSKEAQEIEAIYHTL